MDEKGSAIFCLSLKENNINDISFYTYNKEKELKCQVIPLQNLIILRVIILKKKLLYISNLL